MKPYECQWPGKQKHPDRDSAALAIRLMYAGGHGHPDLHPYECIGHWHVGHSRQHFNRRLQQALRTSRPKRGKANKR